MFPRTLSNNAASPVAGVRAILPRSSMAERALYKRRVDGSSPSGATNLSACLSARTAAGNLELLASTGRDGANVAALTNFKGVACTSMRGTLRWQPERRPAGRVPAVNFPRRLSGGAVPGAGRFFLFVPQFPGLL